MDGYSRDDFDVPVEDYDFGSVEDVGSLIDQMSRAGFHSDEISERT